MSSKTLSIPEEAVVNMLKTLPEDMLVDVFWKTMQESDTSALTQEEREGIGRAKKEFEKSETIKWEKLR